MSKCRHDELRGIYGDEINHVNGKRSQCLKCGTYFDNLPPKASGSTSDGYHTFDELYEFRKLYKAALFNELGSSDPYMAHKSYKHSDGELCFGGGWFIVTAYLNGKQISNHYENKDWDLFKVEERDMADEWDGHTPQDVVERLEAFIKSQRNGD